jgi:SPP1 gp7 family putative phage head morphogenesis protein
METKYPWVKENPLTQRAPAAFPPAENVLPADEKKIKAVKSRDVFGDREKYWEGYVQRSLDIGESQFKKVIIQYFNEQRNRIQDNVDRWLGSEHKSKAVTVTINAEQFLPSEHDEAAKLKTVVKPIIRLQMIREADELANVGIQWRVVDSEVEKYLSERAEYLEGMNKLTFKKVVDDVNEAIAEGMKNSDTVQELARNIKKTIGADYEYRKGHATTIARTEIGAVSSTTRFDAMKSNGIEFIEWVTAGDENVRESHKEVNGQTIKVGEKFEPVDLRFPCESGGDPGEVINCRCVAIPVMEDKETNNEGE